jgi:restriction endonuclease Mrr
MAIPDYQTLMLPLLKLTADSKEYTVHEAVEILGKQFILSVPPYEEQKEIVNRVEKLLSKADEIEKRYKKAKEYVDKLSQSILAKAFRGELVPQDSNDPPASELLEGIKKERSIANKQPIKKRRAGDPAEKLLEKIKAKKEAEEKKRTRGNYA